MKTNTIKTRINDTKLRFKNFVSAGSIGAAVPLRAAMAPLPNIEPVMLFTLTGALVYGPLYGFVIGFLIMMLSDFALRLVGTWTIYTSLTYGFVGFLAGWVGIFKPQIRMSRAGVTLLAFIFTITYDALTAAAFAFNFMIPVTVAFINQIPFTLLHVAGNCTLVFVFAPSLIKVMSIISEPSTTDNLWNRVNITKRYVLDSIKMTMAKISRQ